MGTSKTGGLLPEPARTTVTSVLVGTAIAVVAATLAVPEPGRRDPAMAGLVVAASTIGWLLYLLPGVRRVAGWAGAPACLFAVVALVVATGGVDSPYDTLFGVHVLYGALFLTTRWLVAHLAMVVTSLVLLAYLTARTSAAAAPVAELVTTLALWGAACVVLRLMRREVLARRAEADAEEQRYRSLFEHSPTAIYTLDRDGWVFAVNDAMVQMSGYPADELEGRSFDEVFPRPEGSSSTSEEFRAALAGQVRTLESVLVDATGAVRSLRITQLPVVVNGEVEGVHVVAEDVSELNALHAELERQALHDPLTELANRRLLEERLAHLLAAQQRAHRPVSVLFMDLDGFKNVNDTHGHQLGDLLLEEISARLNDCLRPGDTLARLGGDEFACLLPDTDRAGAEKVAARMIEAVEVPHQLDGHEITVGVSIGVAESNGAATIGLDTLIGEADRAMYKVKRGRARATATAINSAHHPVACSEPR
jgi:diguanylate cyclase (GGDEF)-like protein/PAS domain S-box-containing protein